MQEGFGHVVHSILPYPGTLGPGTAHNSDMPISQNTIHEILLQELYKYWDKALWRASI